MTSDRSIFYELSGHRCPCPYGFIVTSPVAAAPGCEGSSATAQAEERGAEDHRNQPDPQSCSFPGSCLVIRRGIPPTGAFGFVEVLLAAVQARRGGHVG